MSNPFLFDEPEESGEVQVEAYSNPFLQETVGEEEFVAENPFLSQQAANNPFFSNEDEAAAPAVEVVEKAPSDTVDKAMSFFGTTITDTDDEFIEPQAIVNTDILQSEDVKKGPPPRPSPPACPPATQELISSLTDHLDQTSSHLLDRIPVTRTPSPVSIRDLHSPSPTPEVGDLLDVSENVNAVDGLFINQEDSSFASAENPFAGFNDAPAAPIPERPPVPDILAQAKAVPPAPARPTPPRPTPPRRPSPPSQSIPEPVPTAAAKPAEPDLFDVFGTTQAPKQQVPKSNQDILSLFGPQKQAVPEKPDLLTSDIFSLPNIDQSNALPTTFSEVPVAAPQVAAPPVAAPPVVAPPIIALPVAAPPVAAPPVAAPPVPAPPVPAPPVPAPPVPAPPVPAPPAASFFPPAHKDVVPRPPPPAIPAAVKPVPPIVSEHIPAPPAPPTPPEENEVVAAPLNNAALDFTTEIDKCESNSDNSSAVGSTMSRTPEVATPFYVPGGYIENRGQTPVSHDEIANSYSQDINFAAPNAANNPFGSPQETTPINNHAEPANIIINKTDDEFDAFAAKFNSAKPDTLVDGFGSGYKSPAPPSDAWGAADTTNAFGISSGFGDSSGFDNDEDGSDSFLAMQAPPQPAHPKRRPSDETGINVVIRPRQGADSNQAAPFIAPPPRPPNSYVEDSSPLPPARPEPPVARSLPLTDNTKAQQPETLESPSTPLFDDDVSQPLEDFPRITYLGDGWEMQLRQPTKKKITGQRFWKKCFVRIAHQGETPVVHIYNSAKDKDPFQELPLQGCYSVSDISAQPFDQFGKIFTLKLQYIFYKERPGVRPGQVTKAERLTTKLSQFAAFAIQGDYQGVKEFGSDLKKLGLPVEHAPQVSQLFKIGSHSYEDLKQFSVIIEENLFKFNVHRDRALTYKSEEVQLTAVDELYVEQDAEGHVLKQIARVRLFFLGFLCGMPTIELGVNDMWRQGKEVVGRHDIIPVVTEEWIRLEGVEFHMCVQQNEYERTRTIRFQPPDACYIELMRFRIRPPKNRELPLQLKATWCVTGNKVELRADVLVPGFASRKLGQIPCEDVAIRFPIPECWIYLFRVEKHFRYGSVKSAHRRTGKIKGIERILGTMDQLQESLIEVTSGQAKYEHHHRAIVWRCPRLPKEGQGAYTTHQLVVRMALTSYDQIPEQLAPYCYIEFTMPATQASHVTVRSVSVQDSENDDPPEKYVRYLARHEYRVGIEHTHGHEQNAYLAATTVKKEPIKEEAPAPLPPVAGSDSDSDSN